MTFDEWLKIYEQKNIFGPNEFGFTEDHLRECWNAAVADEREACARLADDQAQCYRITQGRANPGTVVGVAIRMRTEGWKPEMGVDD